MDVVVNQDATDLADYDKKKMMRPKFMRIVMMMTLMWIGTMTMQILKILMNNLWLLQDKDMKQRIRVLSELLEISTKG